MRDYIIPAIILLIGLGITIAACFRLKRATAEKDLFLCIVLVAITSLLTPIITIFAGLYVIIKWPRESKQRKNYEEQISHLQTENEQLKRQIESHPRPGSDAHYAAWRAEQMEKKENQ